jgi:hypothetical protein
MLRHPIYLLLCLFAVGYLAVAGTRGWSLFQSVTSGLTRATSAGRGSSSFNHK